MACEKKPVSLVIKENIEMKVFSSKEPCKVLITQEEEEEHSFHQVCLLEYFTTTHYAYCRSSVDSADPMRILFESLRLI